MLDQKIECTSCHRVFFAKTTAGKRTKPPDHTKTYVAFGVGAVFVIGTFIALSGGKGDAPPKKADTPVVQREVLTRGTHPRTLQIVAWAKAIGDNNQFVFETHSDMTAMAGLFGTSASDKDATLAAVGTHETTKWFRDLDADSASLDSDEAMTAATGKAIVYVTPKPGTDDYKKNTRGEIEVSFRMDGSQIKVTGWTVSRPPLRNPAKPDPSKQSFVANKDIAKPDEVEVTDSAGTRKVKESKPTPVPHWDKATPEQQAKADQIVADVLASAADDAPGGLFNRATLSVRTLEERKAVVPRVLNAMYELYGDVQGNNMKLSLLNRSLVTFTGFAVNYQVEDTGDAAKDKAERESCVRQWFAFWWRYSSGDLADFFDQRENLEEPLEEPAKKKTGK